MREAIIPLLACPRATCGGSLRLVAEPAPPVRRGERKIVEGRLRCDRCAAPYPICDGALIAVPNVEEHVDEQLQEAVDDGGLRASDYRVNQQYDSLLALAEAVGMPLDDGFRAWLAASDSPMDVLAAWEEELLPAGGLLLDLGCAAGGLLYRLAPRFEAAIGLDLSAGAVYLARRILLGEPTPARGYDFAARQGRTVRRPLPVERRPNAEAIVGDATAPPFPEGLFDCVTAANLIDAAPLEATLAAAARLLRPGGVLLLADPFHFRTEEWRHSKRDPRAVVRERLEAHGLTLEREQDAVPWAWAATERHVRLWWVWCAAFRR